MSFMWPAHDLARLGFSVARQHGAMLMLACYFDDSGTHRGSPVVVWGGLVAGAEQIAPLDAAWVELLAKPLPWKPPLSQLHLTDCVSGQGEFASYTFAERLRVRRLFSDLVAQSAVMPIAFGVDVAAWDRVVTGRVREGMGDAERASFGLCIRSAFEIACDHAEEMAIYMDQGRQSQGLRLMYEGARELIPEGACYATAEFPFASKTPALQAADLCANEFYRYAGDWIKDSNAEPSPIFGAFLGSLEQSHFAVMGEDQITHLVQEMDAGV